MITKLTGSDSLIYEILKRGFVEAHINNKFRFNVINTDEIFSDYREAIKKKLNIDKIEDSDILICFEPIPQGEQTNVNESNGNNNYLDLDNLLQDTQDAYGGDVSNLYTPVYVVDPNGKSFLAGSTEMIHDDKTGYVAFVIHCSQEAKLDFGLPNDIVSEGDEKEEKEEEDKSEDNKEDGEEPEDNTTDDPPSKDDEDEEDDDGGEEETAAADSGTTEDDSKLRQDIIKQVSRCLYVKDKNEVELFDVDFKNKKTFFVKVTLQK